MNIYQVIIAPVVSEKSVSGQGVGKYSFLVHQHATKADIKKAVEEIYAVRVGSVNIGVRPGKTRRLRTGTAKRRAQRKKAIVTLAEGQVLDTGKVYKEHKKSSPKTTA